MFSDSSAPGSGDQRSFKPHIPHLFPWLRNGLKPHHRGDLGLNGPYKHPTEPHNNLAPLKRAKGLGFLSKELMGNIQGKDTEVKAELHCNGVGLAKRLPVVLREHRVLPENQGRQREDSPARWSQSPELDPETGTNPGQGSQGLSHSTTSVHDYTEYSFVRNHNSHLNLLHSQTDGAHPSVKKYVPPLTPAPVPAPAPPGKFKGQEPNYKVPVVVCTDEGREKLWRYARHTYHQSNLHSSTWLNSDSQGLIDGQQGFSSGFRCTKEQGKHCQSQRDLTRLKEPTGEAFNGPNSTHGIIFSTEVPTRCGGAPNTTLRGPRKPRPISEHGPSLGQNQRWVQSRPASGGDQLSTRKDSGQLGPRCSRKAVRDQIKRVVDNLEQVLGGLKDIHQEMKEVVEQIEYLTTSIDLNEGEEEEEGEGGGGAGGGGGHGAKPPSDSSSSSSSSGVTVRSNHQNPDQEDKQRSTHRFSTIRKRRPFNRVRSQSPQSVLLQTQNTVSSSEKVRPLHLTHNPGSFSKHFGLPSYPSLSVKSDNPPQSQTLTSQSFSSPPHRRSPLPVRPPTPGLSPLTVNLHPPNNTPGPSPSPGPQPRSPGPSSPIRVGPVSPLSPLSSQLPSPPALSPSVIIETKDVSYRTPHSDHPSASPLSPSSAHPPSPSSAPKESRTQPKIDGVSSAGPVQLPLQERGTPANTTRAPLTQGCRGRKPPPYPHNGHFERVKKDKEPRKAPPYPEKRRLLSTTV